MSWLCHVALQGCGGRGRGTTTGIAVNQTSITFTSTKKRYQYQDYGNFSPNRCLDLEDNTTEALQPGLIRSHIHVYRKSWLYPLPLFHFTSLYQQHQAWQPSSCRREETRRTNREHIPILWLLSCYRLTTDLQMQVSHTNNATFTAFHREKALASTTTSHRCSLNAMHPIPSPSAAADVRRGRATKDAIALVQ
jgi:hypothetical protein